MQPPTIHELRRKLSMDSADLAVLAELVHALHKVGHSTKAYSLLLDHGFAPGSQDPLFLAIGRILAESNAKPLKRRLGGNPTFAVEKEKGAWLWLEQEEARTAILPILAIRVSEGPRPTKSLLKSLSFFPLLRFFAAESSRIKDRDLARLSLLNSLRGLELNFCHRITNSGLAYLSSLTTLQSLSLWQANITGQGLAHLAPLSSLKSLNLRSTQVSDAALAHLAPLTSLQSLGLGSTNITDKGLEHLVVLGELESLDLELTRTTGESLARLSSLPSLRSLTLDSCDLTEAGFAQIGLLTALEDLSLFWCSAVTDSSLAHLSALTALESLNLSSCENITENGLASLASLPSLRSLDLTLTGLDEDRARAILPQIEDLRL